LDNGWALKNTLKIGISVDLSYPLSRCPHYEGYEIGPVSTAPLLKHLSSGWIVVTPWDIGVCIDDFHP
jgi:hypothetical protein